MLRFGEILLRIEKGYGTELIKRNFQLQFFK
jgi:hypothetical protein